MTNAKGKEMKTLEPTPSTRNPLEYGPVSRHARGDTFSLECARTPGSDIVAPWIGAGEDVVDALAEGGTEAGVGEGAAGVGRFLEGVRVSRVGWYAGRAG